MVAFLFGAGAERPCFELPTGTEFLEKTLYQDQEKSGDKFRKALKGFFTGKYFDYYKYTAHHINTDIYKFMLEKIIRKNCVDSQKSEEETAALLKKSHGAEVLKEFKKNLEFKKSYDDIKNQFLKDILKEYKDDMDSLSDVGSAGLLDSYFYTIINPPKYSKINFSKIFNYYWSCYFAIAESILKSLEKKNILGSEIEEFYKNGNLDYKKIISKIDTFTRTLYSYKTKILSSYNDSYYACIKETYIKKFLKENDDEFELQGTATTNYFLFQEILLDNPEKTAYLNGKMSLFEFPELLEVRDFSSPKESTASPLSSKHIFFPFIFGQSYLKPVVDKRQTEEFHKFGKILDGSDILVVLGYNINEDDNHVNSFIHGYLKDKNKRLVVVTDKDDEKTIRKKIRAEDLLGDIKIAKADYKKETPAKIVESIFSQCK